MSRLLRVKLFGKAKDTADIKQRIEMGDFEVTFIEIQKTIEFDQDRYYEFCNSMLQKLDCLDGLDYPTNRDFSPAVEIVCPGKQTIYIASEDYSYPRYVGIAHPVELPVDADKYLKQLRSIDNLMDEVKCRIIASGETEYTSQIIAEASRVSSAAQLLLELLDNTKGLGDDKE